MNTHHGDTEARRNAGLLSESLTEAIIAAAIEVHRHLGPDLLESVYEECMCEELRVRGVAFRSQIELPVLYKGRETGGKYRIDLVVADEVVVELKSVERLLGVHEAQLLTYLKIDGQARGATHQFQRRGTSPWNYETGSMNQALRASVPPWWVLYSRRMRE